MKALILNSGVGSRMGPFTENLPKCMLPLGNGQTLLGRQLQLLEKAGITDVVITTGPFESTVKEYAQKTAPNAALTFVHNPEYQSTNYIHSIWLARSLLESDILMMHGDLLFEASVLEGMLASPHSVMAVSTTLALPDKDFKAVVQGGRIAKIGVEFFDSAVAAQPLYRLKKSDWMRWMGAMDAFEKAGRRGCYAEDAFNTVSGACEILPYDVKDRLCAEIDTVQDLENMTRQLLSMRA